MPDQDIHHNQSARTSESMAYWAGWSEARANPNSVARKVINAISLQIDKAEMISHELEPSLTLSRADPDRFIYKAWVIGEQDVEIYPEELGTPDDFLAEVTVMNGHVDDQTVAVAEVTPDNFRMVTPTAFFVSGDISLDEFELSGDPSMGEYNPVTGEYLLTTVSGEFTDPSYFHAINLPQQFSNKIDAELAFRTFVDPTYSDVTLEFEAPISGSRLVLDYHLKESPVTTREIDNEESLGSGVTWTQTQDWKRDYMPEYDIDNDGIIDYREIEGVQAHMGLRKSDFTPTEWRENYERYDVAKDGIIDSRDLEHLQVLSGTIIAEGGDILEFEYPGLYTITFTIPEDGLAATTSLYRRAAGSDVRVALSIEQMRNEKFEHLDSQLPGGFVDVAYDPSQDIFYYLDKVDWAIYARKFGPVGEVRESFKIILPIEHQDMEHRGITYIDGRLYVLVIINKVPWIYLIQTEYANPEASLVKIPIHSGSKLSTDVDVYLRDENGLTSGTTSLGSIDSDRLVTIDNGSIKVLYPLFDVFTKEVDPRTEKMTLLTREKYGTVALDPEATVHQTYNPVWNVFDEFALERGLERYPGEDNHDLKNTCMDVFQNKWTIDPQGVHNGLSRALRSDPYILSGMTHFQLVDTPTNDGISGTVLEYNNEGVYWNTVNEKKIYRDSAYLYSRYTFYSGTAEVFRIDGDILVVNEDTII